MLALAIALACLGLAAVGCETIQEIESDVPKLQTVWSPWIGSGDAQFHMSKASPGSLMMRQSHGNRGGLLLARREGAILHMPKATAEWVVTEQMKQFPVYRYDPDSDNLVAASQDDWDRAAGDVVECDYDDPGAVRLYVDPRKYRLEIGGWPIETVAPLAVNVRLSRGGQFAAVLSAGQRSETLMPFLSGGTAKGQHYHQILDVTNRTFQQGAVRIPLVSEGGLQCCWSPDDRYVVYYNGSELAMVPFDASAGFEKPAQP